MDTVLTIMFGVLGIGLMILIHELGHYIAARVVGVHVEVFSIGWGRRLFGLRRGGTWYQVSWFPFGGYCKMRGDEILRGSGREEWPAESKEEQGAFFSVGPWQRIIIIVAGPVANMAFAILMLTVISWAGFTVRSPGTRIVVPEVAESPAVNAGLETGDRIVAVGGRRVQSFQDIIREVSSSARRELRIELDRDGRALATNVTPNLDPKTQAGRIGIYAWIDPVVGEVAGRGGEEREDERERVAQASGRLVQKLLVGDLIVAVNGGLVANTIDLYEALQRNNSPVELTVERNGHLVQLLHDFEVNSAGIELNGVRLRIPLIRYQNESPGKAFRSAFNEVGHTVRVTIEGMVRLLRGSSMQDAVAGPLRLTYYVGAVATSGLRIGVAAGLTDFFRFLSLISVVLFLMNLLPIPALDGGHIVLYGVEVAMGRRVKPAIIYRIQTVGLLFLIFIAISVTLSDILFLAGRR